MSQGKKRSGKTPEKKTADFVLAYRNTKPNRVKPKKQKSPEKPKKPKPEPVFFVMEHENMYPIDDDTM